MTLRIKASYARDKPGIEPDEAPDIEVFDKDSNLKAIGEVKTPDNLEEHDFRKQIIPFAEKALRLKIPFYLAIPEVNKEKTLELIKKYGTLKRLYNSKLLILHSYDNPKKISLKKIVFD